MPNPRPDRRAGARLPLAPLLALALAACAAPGEDAANPLAGVDAGRHALPADLRIVNGLCFREVGEERGAFITSPRDCLAALEAHR